MAEEVNDAEVINSDESQLDTLRESIDDPVVLKEQLGKEAEARRQLTARAKKAETDLKAEREARIKAEEGNKEQITSTSTKPMEDERLELRFQGYSKEHVDFIMSNGGTEALKNKDSMVSIAIKAQREQAKAEEAAAQTDSSAGGDQFREVNYALPRNPSLKDLKSSVADMEKNLPHAE